MTDSNAPLLERALAMGIKHLPGCRPWKKPGNSDLWICKCGATELEWQIREALTALKGNSK